ncbi:MAG: homoserine O-acetyltransferase, partial [Phycisphaerales bacterium]|nr:homoserine O-acetyltransferase [Phycisphaerales bacterium]
RLGPITVTYETYGKLSDARDNAVFICHALTGDAHAAGFHDASTKRPGWWEIMIGPGKPIDTDRYFVICANVLGGCRGTTGPSSVNPETGETWGLDFPVVTIGDMVKVHKRLTEHLGIERLLAVVGGSMGGMQVLDWAVRYPQSVAGAIAIATTPRLSAQSIAFDAIGRTAILSDPNFNAGRYAEDGGPAEGLAIARMIGHITYLSEQGMHEKFGRQLRHADRYRYDFSHEFSVETYLNHQGRAFVERFDANSYLYVTKAMDYFDLTAQRGSLADALRDVSARFLLVSFKSDWLFTPAQSRQVVDGLLANQKRVTYCDIDSQYGHDAFLLEPERLGRLIRGHLEGVQHREQTGKSRLGQFVTPFTEESQTRQRHDHDCIASWIEPQTRVLDLGCGDGALLHRLRVSKQVRGLGIERDESAVLDCVDRGITVVHGELEEELAKFPDNVFDVVILSQTLQSLDAPEKVLREMLRVGRECIVSFSNGAYWQRRITLVGGRVAPLGGATSWHAGPLERGLSLKDFLERCADDGLRVDRVAALKAESGRPVRWGANLRAAEAVVRLRSQS